MKHINKIICSVIAISLMLSCFALPSYASKVSYSGSQEYISSEFGKKLFDVDLTGDQKQDVLNVLYSQIGYHEGALSGNGESPNDLTEYNRWYYNSSSTKVPWCATFVSWVFRQAGVPVETLNNFSGCSSAVSNLSSGNWGDGVWHDAYLNGGSYTPRKGDLIFFAWQENFKFTPHKYYVNGDGQVNHVGIVVEDAEGPNSCIKTIEGNAKSCCDKGCCVKLCLRSPYDVVGYFTPNYEYTSSSLGKVEITIPENETNVWISPDNPSSISWKPFEGASYYEYTIRSQVRNSDGTYHEIDEFICSNVTTSDCAIPLKDNPEFSRPLREAEAFKIWIGARDCSGNLIAESFVYIRMSDSEIQEDITEDYNDPLPDYSYENSKDDTIDSPNKPVISDGDEDPVPNKGYENPYGESVGESDSGGTTDITETQEDSNESISMLKRILYLLELLLSFLGVSF